MSKSYLLTGIDPKLWQEFKSVCVRQDISMRDSFIDHMVSTVQDFKLYALDKDETISKPKKGGKKK